MMHVPLSSIDLILQGLLLILWATAAACAFRITRSSTQAALRRRGRMLIWLLLSVLLLTGGSVLRMILALFTPSSSALHEGLLLQAPLLLLSAAGVLLFTLPRLWTIVRYIGSARKAPTDEQRGMTTNPYFVTPMLVAACSTACSLYYAIAPPLALSLSWRQLLLPVLSLILLLSLASFIQLRFHRRMNDQAPAGRIAAAQRSVPLPVGVYRHGEAAVAVSQADAV